MNNNELNRTSFLIKFIECFLVAFAIINVYNTLIVYFISTRFPGAVSALNSLRFFGMLIVIFCAFFAVVYPIVWHVKEKLGRVKSILHHAFFINVIRIWLAVMICSYGFAKIIGTQFSPDLVRDNSLMKDLSGFNLTWFYFGYSYPFAVIVALLQLGGSVFLLFRKTMFLGVCILLPVIFNIVFINLFYKISGGAQMNAIFFAIALVFLLSLFTKEIKQLISRSANYLPEFRLSPIVKNLFRIAVIGCAFFFIYWLSAVGAAPKFLVGRWEVTSLVKGRDTLSSIAWLTDSTAWKNIYLNSNGTITATPNPYLIERDRAMSGKFHYDSTSHILSVLFTKQKNTIASFEFQVIKIDGNRMQWIGQDANNVLQLTLLKTD